MSKCVNKKSKGFIAVAKKIGENAAEYLIETHPDFLKDDFAIDSWNDLVKAYKKLPYSQGSRVTNYMLKTIDSDLFKSENTSEHVENLLRLGGLVSVAVKTGGSAYKVFKIKGSNAAEGYSKTFVNNKFYEASKRNESKIYVENKQLIESLASALDMHYGLKNTFLIHDMPGTVSMSLYMASDINSLLNKTAEPISETVPPTASEVFFGDLNNYTEEIDLKAIELLIEFGKIKNADGFASLDKKTKSKYRSMAYDAIYGDISYYPTIDPITGNLNTPKISMLADIRKTYLKRALYPKYNNAINSKNKAVIESTLNEIEVLNAELDELNTTTSVKDALNFIAADRDFIRDTISEAKLTRRELDIYDYTFIETIIANYTNDYSINELKRSLFDDLIIDGVLSSSDYDTYRQIISDIKQMTIEYDSYRNKFLDKWVSEHFQNIKPESLNLASIAETLKYIKQLYGIPENQNVSSFSRDASNLEAELGSLGDINNVWAQIIFDKVTRINHKSREEFNLFNKKLDELTRKLKKDSKWDKLAVSIRNTKNHVKHVGVFAPFLQFDSNNNPTGSLVTMYSSFFYESRKKVQPSSADYKSKSVASAVKINNWVNWRKSNLILFDFRKLFAAEYASEDPNAVTFTQSEIDDHINEIIAHIGQQEYQRLMANAADKINSYLNAKANLLAAYNSPSRTANDIVAYEKFVETSSPFRAADKFFDNSAGKTIANVTYTHTGWKYAINVPRRFYSGGTSTGYYDSQYEEILNNPTALEFYEFIQKSIQEYLDIYPQAFVENRTSGMLPRINKANPLGEYIINKEYNKVLRRLYKVNVSPNILVNLADNIGLMANTGSLYSEIPVDVFKRKEMYLQTTGISDMSVEDQELYIPDVVKAFAYASILYRNKTAITTDLLLAKGVIDKLVHRKDNVETVNVQNIKQAYDTFSDNFYERFNKEIARSRTFKDTLGREKTITDLTAYNVFTKWMYATLLGWNIKIAGVQFVSNFKYAFDQAFGGQFVDLKDFLTAYAYMSPTVIKFMGDAMSPILYPAKKLWGSELPYEKTLPYKIKNIITKNNVFETIAMTMTNEEGKHIYNSDDPNFKETVKAWWAEIASPSALMKQADYLNQGALFLAYVMKTKVKIAGTEYSLFDLYGSDGVIDLDVENKIIKFGNNVFSVTDDEIAEIQKQSYKGIEGGKELLIMTFGNYQNKRSPVTVKRTTVGKALIAFKSWIFSQGSSLYANPRHNPILNQTTAGTYKDWGFLGYRAVNIFNPKKLIENIKNAYGDKKLSKWNTPETYHYRSNFRKAHSHFITIMLLSALSLLDILSKVSDDDDEETDGVVNYLKNILNKFFVEYTFFDNPLSVLVIAKNTVAPLAFAGRIVYLGLEFVVDGGVWNPKIVEYKDFEVNRKKQKMVRGRPIDRLGEKAFWGLVPGASAVKKNKETLQEIEKIIQNR